MAYISSNANRWYCAREATYGQIPTVTAENRIPAVGLTIQQQRDKSQRRDKTGSRTWTGAPSGMRRYTSFGLSSYMRDWADTSVLPPQGPLFEASLGGDGELWSGATIGEDTDESSLKFTAAHNLAPGQAIASGGEIRFVTAVVDPTTVLVNAPFSIAPPIGVPLSPTATYTPDSELPSVSLFDYWDPVSAVQRVIHGVAVDRLQIMLNGDFHEFEFRGIGQDLIDSTSYEAGQGGLTAFPGEPAPGSHIYSPVPGNLGQVWLGVLPQKMLTVSSASIELRNNIEPRHNEYGSILPRAITPGQREVTVSLELFGQDDEATTALYQAARQHSPISMMFQLGHHTGQLMGIHMKSLIPDVPEFDDAEKRLRWKFRETRAQGTADDEIIVAFG